MALSQKFKTNEANAAIDHALLLNPNSSKDNVWKGIVLGMESKNDDVQGYLDKGLMFDPNNAFGWVSKGMVVKAKGNRMEESVIIKQFGVQTNGKTSI